MPYGNDGYAWKRKTGVLDPKRHPGFFPYKHWDGDTPLIECKPMKAKLTERGCGANKEVCKTAIIQILEGLSPFSLSPTELDRLMWCSSCDRYLRWDDVAYTRNRREYNQKAVDVVELEIECAQDVVDLALDALKDNFLRIEDMDLEKGNPDTRLYRRREAKREREMRERTEELLGTFVANEEED